MSKAPSSAVVALLLAVGGPAAAQDMCSGYQSSINCIGKKRPLHNGMDFGGPAGSEAISATYGTVVERNFDECSGHGLTVRTDFSLYESPVYVRYAHVEGYPRIQRGVALKPGDPIGTLIPLRHTRCHGSRTHVHYELRVNGDPKRPIDPSPYWADGPGKVTCFREGMVVPPGKAIAPRRCD